MGPAQGGQLKPLGQELGSHGGRAVQWPSPGSHPQHTSCQSLGLTPPPQWHPLPGTCEAVPQGLLSLESCQASAHTWLPQTPQGVPPFVTTVSHGSVGPEGLVQGAHLSSSHVYCAPAVGQERF